MKLVTHTAQQFAQAMLALLPPGAAWTWAEGGFGYQLFLALSQELTRIEALLQLVLDDAIEQHRPAATSWHINEYRRVANEVLADIETNQTLVQLQDGVKPLVAGFRVGDRCWSTRARYILRVRYNPALVNPDIVFAALNSFKQAHVYLWFENINDSGDVKYYAQN